MEVIHQVDRMEKGLIGTPSATRYTKAFGGEDWREVYVACKEMSRAVGVKKPQEPQKSISPLENEGSKGCGRRIILRLQSGKTTSWEETRHD